MSLVRLDNISKYYLGEAVLDGVSFRVEAGERIGLIGRNGSGKSTLFRIITGEVTPDDGTVERARRLRMASLAQLPRFDGETTVMDIALEAFAEVRAMEQELARLGEAMARHEPGAVEAYARLEHEFEARGGWDYPNRIRRTLSGLGFRDTEFSLPFRVLSGGQRTRLMLALVLLREADLLLLDEPENHLDMDAREWLEDYLQECGQAVVIISHDRRMLDAVAHRIVEIERGRLWEFSGNYAYYLAQKALIREQQQKAWERQEAYIRKQEVFIERFRYKNTKARQVQSRIRALEKMERVEAPPPEADTAAFRLGSVAVSGEVALEARDLAMAHGNLVLYDGVSFVLRRGERIGLIGPNGSGKTTLLRQLAGRIPGTRGEVRPGHKISVGFFEQHHESLNPRWDVVTAMLDARPDWTPEQARTFLGRLLFSGDDVFKPVDALSGGELARLAMGRLIAGGANVLLLDEPTNHLDIASREALENALAESNASMIVASHDRALVDRLATRLIVLRNGQAEIFIGNYSEYHERQRARMPEMDERDGPARRTEEALRVRERKRPDQSADNSAAEDPRAERKAKERAQRQRQRRLEQVEADIAAMESLLAEYSARFAALDPADYQAAASLTEEYENLKRDLSELYSAWEDLAGEDG
ncbi:MAG TPA: ABC-F family ATP-binding cassette domain-containing protein [Candidatus Hydrogenedentes bacterium]|nr:ABC-F family ATP-binding cassette domain-containing protein [Candidatus Hydrogenedentota bacterium]